jgi:hypothetical protein
VGVVLGDVVVGGDPTLTAATARLAHDKMLAAERAVREVQEKADLQVERIKAEMYGSVRPPQPV